LAANAFETLLVESRGDIAWIILNRPERLNAINEKMLDELLEAVRFFEGVKSVKSLIITGGGKAFSAGADIGELERATPMDAHRLSIKGQRVLSIIEDFPRPVIAALNGYAMGGGLELALACDFRVASTDAELGFPEADLGIMPGWGGTQRLARLVPMSQAKRMILLGEKVGAEEALRIGLVDKVVRPEALREEAEALAVRLAERAPNALWNAKLALNRGAYASLGVGLSLESALMALLFSTSDFRRGIEAFKSRVRPNFKGE